MCVTHIGRYFFARLVKKEKNTLYLELIRQPIREESVRSSGLNVTRKERISIHVSI